jgi:citrate/tricarballylate utilization protein
MWLKFLRDRGLSDHSQTGMDVAFLVLLFLTSLTGFLLLVFREAPSMGVLLAIHLGVVAGLFITMPYGKFVHAIYRFAALVRNALEAERDVQARRLE